MEPDATGSLDRPTPSPATAEPPTDGRPADPTGALRPRIEPARAHHDLATERPVPCRADSPRLRTAEIADLATEVPEWRVTERNGVVRLERTYAMPSYLAALDFTHRVGLLAEAADHHPAILVEYSRVTVRWWTLAVRGLHRNDFVMAAKTDRLYDEWEWDGV